MFRRGRLGRNYFRVLVPLLLLLAVAVFSFALFAAAVDAGIGQLLKRGMERLIGDG